MKISKLQKLKNKAFTDKGVKKEYDRLESEFCSIEQSIKKRLSDSEKQIKQDKVIAHNQAKKKLGKWLK